MPSDPTKPLLRLNPGQPQPRLPGRRAVIPRPEAYPRADQEQRVGRRFARLAEVLARYRDVRIIIELKTASAELARAVVAAVRGAEAVERVCVGSFDVRGLRVVRALEPAITTSAGRVEVMWALLKVWCRLPLTTAPYAGFQVPERSGRTRVISPAFVRSAHRAGFGVHVWTVDRSDDARRLIGYGVDALITDRPDVVMPICRGEVRH